MEHYAQSGYPVVVALIAAFASCFTAWQSRRNSMSIHRVHRDTGDSLTALRMELDVCKKLLQSQREEGLLRRVNPS